MLSASVRADGGEARRLLRLFMRGHGPILLFLAAVTGFRLLAAAHIHLTEDEAYYRLWAQHPQLGYYDHPPMIAWWIHAGVRIVGDTPLGVRLFPILSGLVVGLLVYGVPGVLQQPRELGARAVVWFNATLIIGLGGMLAVPDAPAALFWALSLWCLAQLARKEAAGWWIALGASAGLACLSKYSGLFLAPGVLLWLSGRPGGLRMLTGPWPWVAASIATLIFAPNIVWNAEHGWMAFVTQFGRAVPEHLSPQHLGEFIFFQFILLTPPIAVFAALGAGRGWKRRPEAGEALGWLALSTALPFAGYLVVHSLHHPVQEHWAAPLYANATLLAALAAQVRGRGWIWLKSWAPAGLAVSSLALLHAALLRTGVGTFDPVLPIRGWSRFSRDVEQMRVREGTAWVGVLSYGTRAQLLDERDVQAPIIQLRERARYPSLGERDEADLNRPGLVVDLSRRLDRRELARCFRDVGPAQSLDRGAHNGPAARYTAVVVRNPRVDVLRTGCRLARAVDP